MRFLLIVRLLTNWLVVQIHTDAHQYAHSHFPHPISPTHSPSPPPLSLSLQAALAAVIMMSINSLMSFSDIWEAFKHDKKDFLVILVTLVVTFAFETSIGLAVGKEIKLKEV